MKRKPVAIVILDGIGVAPEGAGNAVKLANTPNIDAWREEYPSRLIEASGLPVGLPDGQMGNSEVGHLNIGAGRTVYQSLTLIDKHIKDDILKDNKILKETIDFVKKNNSKLNIFSLVSNGGVHSSNEHIIALNKIAKENNIEVVLHAFSDGRDVAPKSAIEYFKQLTDHDIKIGSISGRYYAMDRDKKWDRTKLSYDAIIGKSNKTFSSIEDYINEEYSNDITDEFFTPATNSTFKGILEDGDAVLFANFRPDRARQLSHMFIGSNTEVTKYDYVNEDKYDNLWFASIMEYAGIENAKVLFPPVRMEGLLGETLEKAGLKQMRAAETEKYPHVTFFMDGGQEIPKQNEKRVLVQSPLVATYDLEPEMSARELTDKILENANDIDAFIINYAQPDMVGHTGSIPAVIKSVEVADEMLLKLYNYIVKEKEGTMIIFADHGNAERMLDEKGDIVTKHTTNPVEVIITKKNISLRDDEGKLGDIAPTMLDLLEIEKPKEMTGISLIKK